MNISKPFDTTTFRDRISVIRRGMDKQSTLSLSRSNLVETTTLPYLHGREKRANRGGARDRLGGGRSTALPRVSERILRRRVHAEPPPPRAVLRLQPRRLRRLVRRARRPALGRSRRRRLIRVEIAFFDAERCTRRGAGVPAGVPGGVPGGARGPQRARLGDGRVVRRRIREV